jgi:membrane-bound ClpP family serine protease
VARKWLGAGLSAVVDRVIPFYVWFGYGFATISVFIGIINFGMLVVTMITVKGIYVPSWAVVILALLVFVVCVSTGYLFDKYKIWKRITSYQNIHANPELKGIYDDVKCIRELLEKKS